MHYRKNKYLTGNLFFLIIGGLLLAGCGGSYGVAGAKTSKGKALFFPKVGIVVKRSFYRDVLEKPENIDSRPERKKLDRYYVHKIEQILKVSRYFSSVSLQKEDYMIIFDLKQYDLTPTSDYLLLIVSPFDAMMGIKKYMEIEMKVTVLYKGKVQERYAYSEEFEERKRANILKRCDTYIDEFMKQFLKDLAAKSKMKKIEMAVSEVYK